MGARRRRAAAAQRLPDAADGRRGGAGRERRAGRSRTRSTRRCATGRRASTTPIICSARSPGRTPSRLMVREFQRVIGKEARAQILEEEGRLPDAAIACVGGGSNAIGLFADFIDDEGVRLIGVEAAGKGLDGARAWRDPAARPAGRAARRRDLCAAGRGRADRRELVGLGRARLSGGRARSMPSSRTAAGPNMSARPTRRRWTLSPCWRGPKGSSARSNPPMRWPMR